MESASTPSRRDTANQQPANVDDAGLLTSDSPPPTDANYRPHQARAAAFPSDTLELETDAVTADGDAAVGGVDHARASPARPRWRNVHVKVGHHGDDAHVASSRTDLLVDIDIVSRLIAIAYRGRSRGRLRVKTGWGRSPPPWSVSHLNFMDRGFSGVGIDTRNRCGNSHGDEEGELDDTTKVVTEAHREHVT